MIVIGWLTKLKVFPSRCFPEKVCPLWVDRFHGDPCTRVLLLAWKEASSADLIVRQFIPKIVADLLCVRHFLATKDSQHFQTWRSSVSSVWTIVMPVTIISHTKQLLTHFFLFGFYHGAHQSFTLLVQMPPLCWTEIFPGAIFTFPISPDNVRGQSYLLWSISKTKCQFPPGQGTQEKRKERAVGKIWMELQACCQIKALLPQDLRYS